MSYKRDDIGNTVMGSLLHPFELQKYSTDRIWWSETSPKMRHRGICDREFNDASHELEQFTSKHQESKMENKWH